MCGSPRLRQVSRRPRRHFVVQRAPAAPRRRGAAAIDHEGDAARDLRGEMGVDALDMPGRRCGQLAAGEEGDGAFGAAGLTARECRRLGAAVRHVAQREVVVRGGHVARIDHVASRLEADLAHGEIVRAQRVAQSAQRAAVDHAIGLAHAHDDADVVIDVAHISLRIASVVLEEFARLDAFHAAAGETARRFGDRLVAVVTMLGRRRLDRRLWARGRRRSRRGRRPRRHRRGGSPSAKRPAGTDRSKPPRDGRRRPSRSANRSRRARRERRRRRLSGGWWRASPGRRRRGPSSVRRMTEAKSSAGPGPSASSAASCDSINASSPSEPSLPTMRDRQRISTPSVVRAPRSASIAEGGKTSA